MPSYSPFEKDLVEIGEQELLKLVENKIAEGWYIEYKEGLPRKGGKLDGAKLAKSVSAFANTKGGWLFYGIKTKTNVPTELCGIELEKGENLLDQFTQAISGNISPKPIYHTKLISLSNDRHALAVEIEESPIPPYITSDGSIYQRENDQSHPIRDRYIIQKLTEKADSYFEMIERFCVTNYGETRGQAESDHSNIEFYFFPLPYNSFWFDEFNTSQFFEKVSSTFKEGIGVSTGEESAESFSLYFNMNYNSFSSSQGSIVIRPLNEHNVAYRTPTVELFANGNLKYSGSIHEFKFKSIPDRYKNSPILEYLLDKYSPYEEREIFTVHSTRSGKTHTQFSRKDSDFTEHIRIIDGADLLFSFVVVGLAYKDILLKSGFNKEAEIGVRAKVKGVWRRFVFWDNQSLFEKMKEFYVSLCAKGEVEVPTFTKGNFYAFKWEENPNDLFWIGIQILKAIGLPDPNGLEFSAIITEYIKKRGVRNSD